GRVGRQGPAGAARDLPAGRGRARRRARRRPGRRGRGGRTPHARGHQPGRRARPGGPVPARLLPAHPAARGAARARAGRAGARRGRARRARDRHDPAGGAPMTSTVTRPAAPAATPATETLSLARAINRALRDAMAEDPSVLVLGEDVGALGGVFRVTDGLTAEFGEDRCVDTPLAEAGIMGFAVGLATNGMRPVVEMQFDAFAYPAFEQVVSHVAKMRNRTRGRVGLPVVVRVPYAGGIGGVEHHSDSSESYYAHTP